MAKRKSKFNYVMIDSAQVKRLCEEYGVEFNGSNDERIIDSLGRALEYPLGGPNLPKEKWLTQEEFEAKPRMEQRRLVALGEAVVDGTVRIVRRGGRSPGMTSAVREALTTLFRESDNVSLKDVFDYIDEKGIEYKSKNSLRVTIYRHRDLMGFPDFTSDHRTGIIADIRKLFDGGRGVVTVSGIVEELIARGMTFSINTVKSELRKLKKEFGLSKYSAPKY